MRLAPFSFPGEVTGALPDVDARRVFAVVRMMRFRGEVGGCAWSARLRSGSKFDAAQCDANRAVKGDVVATTRARWRRERVWAWLRLQRRLLSAKAVQAKRCWAEEESVWTRRTRGGRMRVVRERVGVAAASRRGSVPGQQMRSCLPNFTANVWKPKAGCPNAAGGLRANIRRGAEAVLGGDAARRHDGCRR